MFCLHCRSVTLDDFCCSAKTNGVNMSYDFDQYAVTCWLTCYDMLTDALQHVVSEGAAGNRCFYFFKSNK